LGGEVRDPVAELFFFLVFFFFFFFFFFYWVRGVSELCFEAEDAGRSAGSVRRCRLIGARAFQTEGAMTPPPSAARRVSGGRGTRVIAPRWTGQRARPLISGHDAGGRGTGTVDATRRATDPARAAGEWLGSSADAILDQGLSRRTRARSGRLSAHIRSAALVLGVAAIAGNANGEGFRVGVRCRMAEAESKMACPS